MSCPGREKLDALVAGELPATAAASVEAHAASCAACARRLAWLVHEDDAIHAFASAHAGGDVARLWDGVEARLQGTRKPRHAWLAAAVAFVVLAGAGAALRLHVDEGEGTASADHAMAQAEDDYQRAISALETRLAHAKDHAALNQARTGLAHARASVRGDAGARRRLLEGYATYLKSLRRALQEEEQL